MATTNAATERWAEVRLHISNEATKTKSSGIPDCVISLAKKDAAPESVSCAIHIAGCRGYNDIRNAFPGATATTANAATVAIKAVMKTRLRKIIVSAARARICASVLLSENPASTNGRSASYQRTDRRPTVVASQAVIPAIGTTYVSSPVCHRIDCGTSGAPSAAA